MTMSSSDIPNDAMLQPRSSYIYFSNDTRAEVKKEDPSLSAPDVMRELGRRWKELSDEQKAPFVAQAVKDKVQRSRHTAFNSKAKVKNKEQRQK